MLVLALAKPLGFADPPPGQKQDRVLLGTLHPTCLVHSSLQVPGVVHAFPTRLTGRGRSPLGQPRCALGFVLRASCSGLRAPRGPTSDAPLWCPFLVGFQCCGGTDTCVWLAFSRWPSSLEDAARRAPSEARVPQGDMERWLMAFRRGMGVTAGAVCQKLPIATQVKGPGRAGQGQTAGAATPC